MTDGPAPRFRDQAIAQIKTTEYFALVVRKCPCVNFLKVYAFEKSFLRFRHLGDLFDQRPIYFDANCEVPVFTTADDESESIRFPPDMLVANAFSALGIRPCSSVDDMLCYKLYLKPSQHEHDQHTN